MFFKFSENELQLNILRDHFKSTRIRVFHDQIQVKTAKHIKDIDVLMMLRQKEKWIAKAYQHAIKLKAVQEKVFYLNQEMSVEWITSNRFRYAIAKAVIYIHKSPKLSAEKALQKLYLAEAQKWVQPIFFEEAKRLNLKFQKLQFRNMKNAWGKCSSKQVITLNPKLVSCDPAFIRYVCVHELTHLTHMNHSKHFYHLLNIYLPEYQKYLSLTPFKSYQFD